MPPLPACLLAVGLLGPLAPTGPPGRAESPAPTEREQREATAARRRAAATLAKPPAPAAGGAVGDRHVARVNGRNLFFFNAAPGDPGADDRADDMGIVAPPEPAAGAAPALPTIDFDLAVAFDQVVFLPQHVDPGDVQVHLHERLAAAIRKFESRRPLTGAERDRLWLAGIGDIQHFYARVATARVDFAAEVASGHHAAATDRLQPLAREYGVGPFGPTSLFAKTGAQLRGGH